MFYFSHYIYMYVFIEMGANPLLSTTDGRIGRIHVLRRGWKQDINPNKPLGEDGGRCPCCFASALVL